MELRRVRSLSDCAPLHPGLGLLLKPSAKLRLRLALPDEEGGVGAERVSAFEAVERVRKLTDADSFASLKVSATSRRGVTLDGELHERRHLKETLRKLDGAKVRLRDFPEPLRLFAVEVDSDCPAKHAWDSFFRDARHMDEMKAGERPDTLVLEGLPVEWFVAASASTQLPSEKLFREAFERYGKVRRVDIPVCDPYRKRMNRDISGDDFTQSSLRFKGYVQYCEYSGFARAMEALAGHKLVKKLDNGESLSADYKLDFDRTKHLSDASIKRRSIVRERLVAREKTQLDTQTREIVKSAKRQEAERREKDQRERETLLRRQEREQRRKAKQLAKLKEKEAVEINSKIAQEKKKLLKAQRKLQTIRLMEELFRRLQVKHKNNDISKRDISLTSIDRKDSSNKKEIKKLEKALLSETREKSARDKLVTKYKTAQEQELEEQRIKLQKALDGKIVLRSVLDTGKRKLRTSSVSSLSSCSDIPEYVDKSIKVERTSQEKEGFVKKDPEPSTYPAGMPHYNYNNYGPYPNQNYNYQNIGGFYPRPGYYPQEHGYPNRGRGYIPRRGRGVPYGGRGYRGMPRMPYYDGSDPNQMYYKYFRRLAGSSNYDGRSYSRSRSRSRRRSYSRSRSRTSTSRSRSRSKSRRRSSSYRRRHSRSRSYSRSRSSSRRTRSRSRSRTRSKSRSRHDRTRSRSRTCRTRSRSRHRSRSRNKSRSRSEDKSKRKSSSKSVKEFIPRSVTENMFKNTHKDDKSNVEKLDKVETDKMNDFDSDHIQRDRSKSWSHPAD